MVIWTRQVIVVILSGSVASYDHGNITYVSIATRLKLQDSVSVLYMELSGRRVSSLIALRVVEEYRQPFRSSGQMRRRH